MSGLFELGSISTAITIHLHHYLTSQFTHSATYRLLDNSRQLNDQVRH